MQKYNDLTYLVKNNFEELDKRFEDFFKGNKTKITNDLKKYIFSSSKRIRSLIVFLYLKALDIKIEDKHYKIAQGTEILHNASLIHDDIIDESQKRRNKKALHIKYNSKLAVLAGDYLFNLGIKIIDEANSKFISQNFMQAVEKMINGEIEQYFNRNKVTTIKKYIEKSKYKTAELFIASLTSALENQSDEIQINAKKFAENFGIAFQINNDLKNFLKGKYSDDIKNGIYTAPYIYKLKDEKTYKEKTIRLIQKYTKSAIADLSFIKDNQYKETLINLCELVERLN